MRTHRDIVPEIREPEPDCNRAVDWRPGKLWSLWDLMINFEISGVCQLLKGLEGLERDLRARIAFGKKGSPLAKRLTKTLKEGLERFKATPKDTIEADLAALQDEIKQLYEPLSGLATSHLIQDDISHMREWLRFASHHANKLEMQSALDRIEIFEEKLQKEMTMQDFLAEVRTIRETFEKGLKSKSFYYYPQNKSTLLRRYESDWNQAMGAFPAIHGDVAAAVDCYALGHNTASVFHSMRVVEHGLRALAVAVNVSFEVDEWHRIIEQMESQIRELGDKWPKSATKLEWMRFYSGAAKEFFYFKDGWRNYVSHGGDPYDEHQALSVLEHTRTFMTHLATRFAAQAA